MGQQRASLEEIARTPQELAARDYQLKILAQARCKNTIAFLETGTGKTYISIMLIRGMALPAKRTPGSLVAAFLAPTVPLVDQQAEALQTHTDLEVGSYVGAMGIDFWSPEKWKEEFKRIQVMVCTPQVLLDRLRHGLLSLENIKLLVMDECHHAHKRHPLALIMEEFYWQMEPGKRPSVFGMTASPVIKKGVTSQQDCALQFKTLEATLGATIMTIGDSKELERCAPTPLQKLAVYSPSDPALYSSLLFQLTYWADLARTAVVLRDANAKYFIAPEGQSGGETLAVVETDWGKVTARKLAAVAEALQQMGRWCAYKAARRLLGELNDEEAEDSNSSNDSTIGIENVAGRELRAAGRRLQSYYLQKAKESVKCRLAVEELAEAVKAGLVTPKVAKLVEVLLGHRCQDGKQRCMVFVERVLGAHVLADLLAKVPGIANMAPTALTGHDNKWQYGAGTIQENQAVAKASRMTAKEQRRVIKGFREGKIQVLVATNVAEEGLDIQQCHSVIRFDLPQTIRGFIQSRGRARSPRSAFILMVSQGSEEHSSLLQELKESEEMMKKEALEPTEQDVESEPQSYEEYRVEETKAVVNENSAIALVYRYCSSLPHDSFCAPLPHFKYDSDGSSTRCCVSLPPNAPLGSLWGPGRSKKAEAKRAVCLEVCKQLHAKGELTDHLLVEMGQESEQEDEEDEAEEDSVDHELAAVEAFTGDWLSSEPSATLSLQAHRIHFCPEGYSKDPIQALASDMILLTKEPLDVLPLCFNLHLKRATAPVEISSIGEVELSAERLREAKRFHAWLMDWVLQKYPTDGRVDTSWEQMKAYLVLPEGKATQIDWSLVDSILQSLGKPFFGEACESPSEKTLRFENGAYREEDVNGLLVETTHNQRLYCVGWVCKDLRGESPVLWKSTTHASYAEYYGQKYSKKLKYPNQHLLKAKHLSKAYNMLSIRKEESLDENDTTTSEDADSYVELPPELCTVWKGLPRLGALHLGAICVLSVLHRLETILRATQLQKILKSPTLGWKEILEATTASGCRYGYHYERLELLGDSFLKYTITRYLFIKYPSKHEGQLTPRKEKRISNRNLCKKMVAKGYHRYMDIKQLDFVKTDAKISVKVVADVAEALMGAHFVVGGLEAANTFLIGLDILPSEALDLMKHDIEPLLDKTSPGSRLETLLKYTFKNHELLTEAMTHPSFSGGGFESAAPMRTYQRLEFLGDAVLDLLVTKELYAKNEECAPGILTLLRTECVSNLNLAKVALRHGLHKFLLHDSADLMAAILDFKRDLEAESCEDEEREEPSPPKALGDIVESLAGAVLVDTGFDEEAVWKVFSPLLAPLPTPETLRVHPVSKLCELFSPHVEFKLTSLEDSKQTQVDVLVKGEVVASAKAASKKAARKQAARKALEVLDSSGAFKQLVTEGASLPEAVAKECSAMGPESPRKRKLEENAIQSVPLRQTLIASEASKPEVVATGMKITEISAADTCRSVISGQLCQAMGLTAISGAPRQYAYAANLGWAAQVQAPKLLRLQLNRQQLYELCSKQRWGGPTFELLQEEGPCHAPLFTYSVSVIDDMHKQPLVAVGEAKLTKKAAMDSAAEALGPLLSAQA